MFANWTATDGFLDVKSSVPYRSTDRGYKQQDLSSIRSQKDKIERMMHDGVAPLWLKPTPDKFIDPISTPYFMFHNWLNGEWVGGTSPKYSDEKYDKIGIPFTFVILEGILTNASKEATIASSASLADGNPSPDRRILSNGNQVSTRTVPETDIFKIVDLIVHNLDTVPDPKSAEWATLTVNVSQYAEKASKASLDWNILKKNQASGKNVLEYANDILSWNTQPTDKARAVKTEITGILKHFIQEANSNRSRSRRLRDERETDRRLKRARTTNVKEIWNSVADFVEEVVEKREGTLADAVICFAVGSDVGSFALQLGRTVKPIRIAETIQEIKAEIERSLSVFFVGKFGRYTVDALKDDKLLSNGKNGNIQTRFFEPTQAKTFEDNIENVYSVTNIVRMNEWAQNRLNPAGSEILQKMRQLITELAQESDTKRKVVYVGSAPL